MEYTTLNNGLKQVIFEGTESQMTNLDLACGISDNDLPKNVIKEVRVYVVNIDLIENTHSELIDNEFQELAEESGRVYSLDGFSKAFNDNEINSHIDVIRFVTVTINI